MSNSSFPPLPLVRERSGSSVEMQTFASGCACWSKGIHVWVLEKQAPMCSSASGPQEVSCDLLIYSDLLLLAFISSRGKRLFLVRFNHMGQLAQASE